MGNIGSNEEIQEAVRTCVIEGIGDECIERSRVLQDQGRIELYDEVCDPDLPPPQYDSRGCQRYCDEFGGDVKANCDKRVKERCDNYRMILGELDDNFPECQTVGILESDTVRPGKNKAGGLIMVPIVIIVVLLVIGTIVTLTRRDP